MKWDKFFENLAIDVSKKSKDKSTKIGVVLVGKDHSILDIGFNGFPRGISDEKEHYHQRPKKYMVTEHAERNAIYNCARNGKSTLGTTLYLSSKGLPCADCARAIIQSGISEVVTHKGTFEGVSEHWVESIKTGEEMLLEAGVRIRYYENTSSL
jgi:dCMP deaminase